MHELQEDLAMSDLKELVSAEVRVSLA
jgi:hypothetical protein